MKRFLIVAVLLSCCATPSNRGTFRAAFSHTVDFGAVDDDVMAAALEQFKTVAESGAKEVTLRFDSPGGSIFLGFHWMRAVEDLKKAHGIHVTCIVDGMAYSMAAVVLESPVCDLRLATVRSTILFHNGAGAVQGTAEQIRNATAFLEAENAAMAAMISERIGMPMADYRAKIATGDWVMPAQDALTAHVLDGIAVPGDIEPPATASL